MNSSAAGRVYIGTSGWNYPSWRDTFYAGTPRSEWLAFCAGQFTGIEIDATFYRLQSLETFRRWRRQTPAGFRFAIKAHRFLTHNKKLADPRLPIVRERERAAGLGPKLAAVLWQLPANLHKRLDRLEAFARALYNWRRVRHVVEFRHPSWFDDEVALCLSRHAIAACQSDAADWPLWDAVTTDLVYVRLHGHVVTYASGYSDQQLGRWAERVSRWQREGRDVHIYFDNDALGHAPRDALRLISLLGVDAKGASAPRPGRPTLGRPRAGTRPTPNRTPRSQQ